MMRVVLSVAALAALSASALAQPARAPAAKPAPQAAEAPAQPPDLYPCRTAAEVCYIGVVVGNQLAVLFTNSPKGEGIDAKPVDVHAGEAGGARLDLSQNDGRVVMLTGDYDAKTGITKAEVVDVASPILSSVVKTLLAGGPGGGEPAAAPSPKGKAPPKRR